MARTKTTELMDLIYDKLMKIERVEFAQLMGNVVKVQLKEKDGTFKNHWHRYKTPEKAEYMYEVKWKDINER